MVSGFVARSDQELVLKGQAGNDELQDFGSMWISQQVAVLSANKPAIMAEYGARIGQGGIENTDERMALYQDWLQEVTNSGACGDLVWMTGLPKGPNQPFDPDPCVIGEGPEAAVIREHPRETST